MEGTRRVNQQPWKQYTPHKDKQDHAPEGDRESDKEQAMVQEEWERWFVLILTLIMQISLTIAHNCMY